MPAWKGWIWSRRMSAYSLDKQAVQRPIDEIGVAGQPVAVGVSDFLGLNQQVDGVRRVGRHGREVVAGDDVEHLQQQEPLGRRAGLVNRVLSVSCADRFADVGVLSGKVCLGKQSAVGGGLVQARHELRRQVAAIESVGAALGHAADGLGQVRVGQDFTLARRPAVVGKIDVRGGGVPGQQFRVAGERAGDAGRHGESLLGVPDGRGHQFRHWDGAEIPVHGLPGRRFARHGNGVRAGDGHQGQALLAVVVGLRAGAGDAAAVDVGNFAGCGLVGQDERVAAQAALGNDGNALHRCDGQRSVKRGAPILQDAKAGRRRQRRIGAHHAIPAMHGAAGKVGDGHCRASCA